MMRGMASCFGWPSCHMGFERRCIATLRSKQASGCVLPPSAPQQARGRKDDCDDTRTIAEIDDLRVVSGLVMASASASASASSSASASASTITSSTTANTLRLRAVRRCARSHEQRATCSEQWPALCPELPSRVLCMVVGNLKIPHGGVQVEHMEKTLSS